MRTYEINRGGKIKMYHIDLIISTTAHYKVFELCYKYELLYGV